MYPCRELYFEMHISSEKSHPDILWIKPDHKFFELYIYLAAVYISPEHSSGNNDLESIYSTLLFDFEKHSELGNTITVFMMTSMLTLTPNQILFYLTRIPIVLMVMTFIINMIVHC